MVAGSQKLYEVGAKVFVKAATDPEFRALALRNGTAAVEQVTGTHLPDGLKIRFVEGEGADLTLGLPPVHKTGELSDRELEAVAGAGMTVALQRGLSRAQGKQFLKPSQALSAARCSTVHCSFEPALTAPRRVSMIVPIWIVGLETDDSESHDLTLRRDTSRRR